MISNDVSVSEIMKEVQHNAMLLRVMGNKADDLSKDISLHKEIENLAIEISKLNDKIVKQYQYTKEREDTALKIPVNRNQFVLFRKAKTFVKRLARKLTSFIWLEQNDVNKSLNKSTQLLYQAHIELSKSLIIMNGLIDNIHALNTRIDDLEKKITNISNNHE